MKASIRFLGLAAMALAGTSALAQDFFMGGTSPMDLAPMTRSVTDAAINKHSLNAIRSRNAARGLPAGGAPATPRGGLLTQTATMGPARGERIALPYRATRADQDKAKTAFLGRLKAKDPKTAAIAAPQLMNNDIDAVYARLAADGGLSPNDVADVMTSYLVLAWMIANNDTSATPAAARAAREKVAVLLAQSGALHNPATRTQVAEELKILFCVIQSGWQSARKEGNVAQYSDGINRMLRAQNGEDLRRLALTPAGFRTRG